MMETKLAYHVATSISAYGSGGSVSASFLCATEEKARKLKALLDAMAQDVPPGRGKESKVKDGQ